MKRAFTLVALTAAFVASSAQASTRPAPIPVPGGPIIIHVDPACVLAGNPVIDCIIR